MDLEAEIASALVDLWPQLSPAQQQVVSDRLGSLGASDASSARRATLLWLRAALRNPKEVGVSLNRAACGCEGGFAVSEVNGRTAVAPCPHPQPLR
jgi:hypothetical protein